VWGTNATGDGVDDDCHGHGPDVGTMNISLPDSLKAFVEEQVAAKGCGTSSEYMRELIRKDQDRQHLRNLLLEGAQSVPLD
jgi:antitoxin ParD1/3/4